MQVAWIGVRWEELDPVFRAGLASDPAAGTGLVTINDGDKALGVGLVLGVGEGRMEFNTDSAVWPARFRGVRSKLRYFHFPLMAGTEVRLYIEEAELKL